MAKASLVVVNVETTVQDKAIAFPTDARLLRKATIALVRCAKQLGLPLRQSYREVGRVIRDIERKILKKLRLFYVYWALQLLCLFRFSSI